MMIPPPPPPPRRTPAESLDSAGCAPTAGSDFWECVRQTAETIVETLPKCGSSCLVNESRSLREALARLVGIMERGEAMEIRKAETREEMESREQREHICAMNRDMMGKCFVCGSSSLPNETSAAAGSERNDHE